MLIRPFWNVLQVHCYYDSSIIRILLDYLSLKHQTAFSFTKLTKSKTDKCTFYIGKNVKYSKVQGMG